MRLYLITLAMITLSSNAYAQDNVEVLPSFSHSIRLGRGFNSLAGIHGSEDLSYCIENEGVGTLGNTTGEKLYIYVDSISSSEEFTANVTKSTSLSAGLGGTAETQKVNFLSFNASGNRKYKSSSTYINSYAYMFVQVRKDFQPETLNNFKVPPKVLEYFSENPQEFYSKCADRFVSGVKKGAEVMAILRCKTNSTEDKETIDDLVKANAGYKGFSQNGEVSELIDTIRKMSNNSCTMSVAAQGSSGNYNISDSKDFVASAINYVTSSTPATATPLEIITTSYKAVTDRDFSKNVLNLIDLSLPKQLEFIQKKRSDIDMYITIMEKLEAMNQADKPSHRLAVDKVNKALEKISACINDVYNPKACQDNDIGVRIRGH